jgi:hypothetical protein
MSQLKFDIGQYVQKATGYKFPGVVIGVATKLDGKILYLVECTAEGAEGMCHIFSGNNLEPRAELVEAAPTTPHPTLSKSIYGDCGDPLCIVCRSDGQ